ncbi:Pre-mRNA-splicing factor CWC22-like protein [Nymphaea thermarum]|nr:Pre-mRNA-splicing factor CWC22-like protein [Nymphaea thermarum]
MEKISEDGRVGTADREHERSRRRDRRGNSSEDEGKERERWSGRRTGDGNSRNNDPYGRRDRHESSEEEDGQVLRSRNHTEKKGKASGMSDERDNIDEGNHRRRHQHGNSDEEDREMSRMKSRKRREEISDRRRDERDDDDDYGGRKFDREGKYGYDRNRTRSEGSRHRNEEEKRDGNVRKGDDSGLVERRYSDEKKKVNNVQLQSNDKPANPTGANVGRSGGIYIPPFKLAQMMKNVEDKSSEEYQRLTWDALRKSINGLVNKVNASNVKNIIPELFSENLIRGRGLFCRSCLKSQLASPGFTDVFAALVAVVNTKFPEVGKLLLKRIILRLKRAYKRSDKPLLLAAIKFIAHLVNQQVAHEIIALELLTVLLEKPTDDSVEVAVGFVKECGSLLQDLSPQGLHGIFERLRGILHEGEIDKRVQFLIEGLFAIRKAKFQGYPAVRPELDLVEQEDQFTHEFSLEDEIDGEEGLDIFKYDPQFLEHEKAYENLKREILGEESSDEEAGSEALSDDEEDDDDESDEEDENDLQIADETETNLVNLRRTIYLTIMSSVDFEEAGHKLLKIKLQPGQEMELCIMLLECCSQERTYLRFYGLLGQRFCMINKVHQENFEKCFVQQYSMIHRLETNKLRNVAKFFAHLLGTFALPWHVLAYIRLTEEDTTSSSRIFIKILFQELAEQLGIRLLNEKLSDPTMQDSFESIFPRDNPKNTRFSINFFTSIGLGGITENLRQYLKDMPRLIMQQQKPESGPEDSSDESDESGSSSASESDDPESSSESETESDNDRKRRKRKNDSDSERERGSKSRKRRQKSEDETDSDSSEKRRRHGKRRQKH